jgi:hypothetical protein
MYEKMPERNFIILDSQYVLDNATDNKLYELAQVEPPTEVIRYENIVAKRLLDYVGQEQFKKAD